ncbi:sensor histidine kinase [Faecalispora anaeroviscerum]|uniref:sensor histidine kinase n=1 Tax=Faecalispora anaeroviscerum TaxID=2991836 RepID=UPI0024B8DDE9|nr:ATP-binding protein [Faecalispora anaeroviscerum]
MKKDDLPFNKRKIAFRGVKKSVCSCLSLLKKWKESIVFKTAMVYIIIFGIVLVIAASVMSAAFVSYSAHSEELERTMSFVVSRLEVPQDKQFDFEEFAQFSKTMIEISDVRTREVVRFGEEIQNVREKMQTVRRVDRPDRHLMIKVVSTEYVNTPFEGGVGVAYAFALAGLLIAAVLLGSLSTKKLLHPVYVMTQTARSITANDLSVRIDGGNSNDELDELARTFNEMLDRLEEAYRKQNRFVSDASHELRTPLSVISGYANLLRRWGSEDPAILEESVTKIIEETDNMQQLVERLLFLARVDQQTQQTAPELFDASELMSQIAKETRLIDDSHTLCEQIEPEVQLMADRALILQAVRAIVENSMKYTPPGGTITLACRAEGAQVHLSVADTGIGIEGKDIPYIFDRFYKADEARSRQVGGTGLGLSIVKWIVELHGGTIEVSSIPDNGTEIHILIGRQPCLPF